MTYLLLIVLIFDTPPGRVALPAEQRYSYEECVGLGQLMAEWLTQPGVTVRWACVKDE